MRRDGLTLSEARVQLRRTLHPNRLPIDGAQVLQSARKTESSVRVVARFRPLIGEEAKCAPGGSSVSCVVKNPSFKYLQLELFDATVCILF